MIAGRARATAALASALVLAGIASCGGGGGGNAPPVGAPPVVTITASPSNVEHGGNTTLTWQAANATSCVASGDWSGVRALAGSETVSNLTHNSTYRLGCSNASRSASSAVTVMVRTALPPTLELTVSPTLVRRGETVTATWTTTGATECRWNFGGPPVGEPPLNGSFTVLIEGAPVTRGFSMRCDGPGGSIEKTVYAEVQTLAGALIVPLGINADTDVNDPAAEYSSNDSIDGSVPIPAFGVVPGYVNQPHSGPTGRSYESGDLRDFYRTSTMDADQVIRLVMPTVDAGQPESLRDDADLYLYDIDGRLIDAAIGSGPVEALVVSAAIEYVIEVRSVRGGLNYLLSLEDPATPATGTAERLSAEFVAGEAIVAFEADRGGPRGKVAASRASEGKLAAGRASTAAGSASAAITRLSFPASALGRRKAGIRDSMPRPATVGALQDDQVARLATLLEFKELRLRDDVRHAALNRIVHADDVAPTDPLFSRQWWHYSLASLPAAWQLTTGSPDVIAAIVDSGVVLGHPDLRVKLVGGYDLVSNPDGQDGDGIDPDPSDFGYGTFGSWVFHGTHVAGTIGASANNDIGGAGIAWGARLMPVRVLDGRSGTIYDVLQGVRYAAGLPNDSGHVPPRRADIINVSLGTNGECSELEADVYRQVAAAGVIVVAAAGNNGDNRTRSPAACPEVFAVGAAGPNGTRTSYSNFGPQIDLLAPGGSAGEGEGVYSTHADRMGATVEPTYGWLKGTSMAAAHVSGVFALMKSVRPSLTPLEVRQALEAGLLTVAPFNRTNPSAVRDDDGFGLLDAAKAVAAAKGGIPVGPRLSVTPLSLRFDNFTSSADFQLRNGGSGSLTVQSVRPTVPWATVTPPEGNVDGLGLYRVDVTRDDFRRGTRTGAIEIESSAGSQQVLLTGTYVDYNVQSRPGKLQVRAVDAASGDTVRRLYLEAPPIPPDFRFDDVPPGTYVLVAGTDMNNDGNLCDPGELCGSYPVAGLPDAIDYTGVTVGLEIPIEITALLTADAIEAASSR